MTMTDTSDKLKAIALETAQRLIDYGSYGKSESKAIAAMRRRCPGLEREVYAAILGKAVGIHQDAIGYVKGNTDRIHQSYQDQPDGSGLGNVVTDFIARYSDFPAAHLVSTVGFIYYLHHLR